MTMTVLNKIPETVLQLIEDHREAIEAAWLKNDDESLSINFSVKLAAKDGKNNCEVGISFVKEKVKDKVSFEWDDRQIPLGLGKQKQ